MNFQKLLILITAFMTFIFAGCGGGAANVDNSSNALMNANANFAANAGNAITTTKKPETETTNNAPTVAPVVGAYYDALKKKDDAGMRKVLTQSFIKSIEADMKEEKKTSITAFMAETDIVPDKPVEVRNEKITGETATAEIKGGSYVNWTPFKFIKENGEWKLSNEFPDVDSLKKDPANTATANAEKDSGRTPPMPKNSNKK